MNHLLTHLPMDRLQALLSGRELPRHSTGTLVFADIAGFTPLTERLMRSLGSRRGAEELTQLLDLVYDPLITLVHAYGGSVIGFSGDAITTWFPDPDPRPAMACGLAMQQAMADLAASPPTGQPITLKLKVCIARGPVQRMVVGDPAIQLIDVLAGPTASAAFIESGAALAQAECPAAPFIAACMARAQAAAPAGAASPANQQVSASPAKLITLPPQRSTSPISTP